MGCHKFYFVIEWDGKCLADKKVASFLLLPFCFFFVVVVSWAFALLRFMVFFLHFINIDLLLSAITCDKYTSLYANAHNGNIISRSVSPLPLFAFFIRLLIYYAQKRLLPFATRHFRLFQRGRGVHCTLSTLYECIQPRISPFSDAL